MCTRVIPLRALKDSKHQGGGFYEWLRKIGGTPFVVLLWFIYIIISIGC